MVYAALGIPLILVGMAGLGRTLSAHVSRVLTTLCPGFSTLSYRKAAGEHTHGLVQTQVNGHRKSRHR